jgi:RNA 3'-terminal phosphate cyclase-like protein
VQLLADVYIFTDHMSGKEAGLSPGYGLALVAETTSGRMIAGEAVAAGGASAEEQVPEDVGRAAAHALLEEVRRGGVSDGSHQGLLILLCALGPEELNEVRLGPLTPYAVRTLRHVKEFLGVQFSVRPERDSQTIFLSCIGAGVKNMSKQIR